MKAEAVPGPEASTSSSSATAVRGKSAANRNPSHTVSRLASSTSGIGA